MSSAHEQVKESGDAATKAETATKEKAPTTSTATTTIPSPPPLSGGDATSSVGDASVLGVLTVSDRASKGEYEDLGGPAILRFFEEAIKSPWTAVYRIIPDEQPLIEQELIKMIDEEGCSVVVTTGGTGPAPRDVTPEATVAVCDRVMPGYGEQMRSISLRHVPTAVLSRQTAGTRGKCLILNLPGAPKAIRETVDEVFASVPACVDLLGGPYIETMGPVRAFRPCSLVRKEKLEKKEKEEEGE